MKASQSLVFLVPLAFAFLILAPSPGTMLRAQEPLSAGWHQPGPSPPRVVQSPGSYSGGPVVGGTRLWVDRYGYGSGGWRVGDHPRFLGDFNGDGKADVIGFGNEGTYVSVSTGRRFSAPRRWVDSFAPKAGGWRADRHPRFVADVNGDGRDDIVGFGNRGVYVSLSTGNAFAPPARWSRSFGYEGGWRVGLHPRYLADVDGDGAHDVVGFGDIGIWVARSTGDSFEEPNLWIESFGPDAGGWRADRHPRLLADVNGDSKADVVGFGHDGVHVSLSTGRSFAPRTRWINSFGYGAGGWRVDRHPRMLADVNGDGMADVVGFGSDGVHVSLSTGRSFTSRTRWSNTFGYDAGDWRIDRHPRFLADVNRDGKADVIGFGNRGTHVALSTGRSFGRANLWVSSYGYKATNWRVERHPRLVADVTGDGRVDVVGFGHSGVYVSRSNGVDLFVE